MVAFVIYINGWPGVGKLTVATALQPLIPGSQILHNHELIDPVENIYPRRSPYYHEKREEYRRYRLKPIAEDPKVRDTVFIFTDSQTDHNDCMSDYTDLGRGEHARRFYTVILECEQAENERRLVMSGRGNGVNGKLVDVDVLRKCRAGESSHIFEDTDEIVIDVTHIRAEEAAELISDFVARREVEGRCADDF